MAAKSGWFKVATAGPTIDGRIIEEQWLFDIVETYDLEEYIANIFPDHYSWLGNHGQVLEVKKEKDKKKRWCLFARVKPNRLLLNLNKAGQKLFTSIRVEPDFATTGKAYLSHLAITDTPASLGTSQLEFSKEENQKFSHVFGMEEPIELTFDDSDELDNLAKEVVKNEGLSDRLKRMFSKQNSQEQDDEPMSKADRERLEKLEGQIGEFSTRLENLVEGQINEFKTQLNGLISKKGESNGEGESEFSQKMKDLESQVASLKEENQSYSTLKTDFEKLQGDFADAMKDVGEEPPKGTGEAGEKFEIV
ncbi:GPO family capsid scaffolding protein [Marinomonas sp. PE14-40]|uniref:GPO family capsid scaffolding protein n=1 Tax=Marinomonas sp. PE14-40 TaxID=3060621 RepID=UPI003F67ABFF